MNRQRIMTIVAGVMFLGIGLVLYLGVFSRQPSTGDIAEEFVPLPVLPPVTFETVQPADLMVLDDPRFKALVVFRELPPAAPTVRRSNPFAPLP
ncbi:MAG: hypothetical protein Q8R13_03405 [bacterium]|nr:hypothetical protein [bacterium]MDZ4296264.1 hypothetical protein [Patescibacteria group bacterium]MDZ4296289.1 hypothetical protein [Patescibacteria group bacterium]